MQLQFRVLHIALSEPWMDGTVWDIDARIKLIFQTLLVNFIRMWSVHKSVEISAHWYHGFISYVLHGYSRLLSSKRENKMEWFDNKSVIFTVFFLCLSRKGMLYYHLLCPSYSRFLYIPPPRIKKKHKVKLNVS